MANAAVQAELQAMILGLGQRAARATNAAIADDLEVIRRMAQANGYHPAVTVVHALDSALARGERGPLVQGWLEILADAVNCDRHDPAIESTFAAVCSVRLNS